MQTKKFNDDFLESHNQEKPKIKSNEINIKELRKNSDSNCEYFFENLKICEDTTSQYGKEMCEKVHKSLIYCLKTFGKYHE